MVYGDWNLYSQPLNTVWTAVLPVQDSPGEGFDGAVPDFFAGLDDKVEKAAGNFPFSQFFFDAERAALLMVGRVAAAARISAGAKMFHGEASFKNLYSRLLNAVWPAFSRHTASVSLVIRRDSRENFLVRWEEFPLIQYSRL